MRRSLRNTNRIVWLWFAIALPSIFVIAWSVAPDAKSASVLSAKQASSRDKLIKKFSDCTLAPRFKTSTALAEYQLEHAVCSDKVLIVLMQKVRTPQLALYVSDMRISDGSLKNMDPIAFFNEADHLEIKIPEALLNEDFFILLADNIKHISFDQVIIQIQ
jgi:hypothetical protein